MRSSYEPVTNTLHRKYKSLVGNGFIYLLAYFVLLGISVVKKKKNSDTVEGYILFGFSQTEKKKPFGKAFLQSHRP